MRSETRPRTRIAEVVGSNPIRSTGVRKADADESCGKLRGEGRDDRVA